MSPESRHSTLIWAAPITGTPAILSVAGTTTQHTVLTGIAPTAVIVAVQ